MSRALDLPATLRILESAPHEAERAPGLSAEHADALRRALDRTRQARAGAPASEPKLVRDAVAAVDGERNLEGARLALRALGQGIESVSAFLAAAVALDRLGFCPQALAFYEQALIRSPDDARIAGLLGACALRMGDLNVAEGCFRIAARLDPPDWRHQSNLAGVLRDQGRFDEAIEILRAAIYAHPTTCELWNTLGAVLQEKGEPEQALTFLAEAARLEPRFARAFHNQSSSLCDLGRFDEACAASDAALATTTSPSDRAEMIHTRAMAQLGAGRLAAGWEDYDARLDPLAQAPLDYQIPVPRWRGEALAGKRLALIGEQGLGDEVLFMNAGADALRAVGPAGHLMIACDRRLVALFERSFPGAEIRSHATGRSGGRVIRRVLGFDDWDRFDLWAPIGELARQFRAHVADFPAASGFLIPDPARVQAFKSSLSGGVVHIGIAWKSLVMTPKRARYFAPFEAWAPVFAAPGAQFYNLQPGEVAAEEAIAREAFGIELKRFASLDLKDDLEGVAAAGAALDLVIAPMNASSNLAAACGGAVWFIHSNDEWTMLGAGRLPWYPRTRSFTARWIGDWPPVFAAIAEALAAGPSRLAM